MNPQLLQFPDLEAAATTYLAPLLPGVHVGAQKLPDKPVQVIVRDDGGVMLEYPRAEARMGFNVYGQTQAETMRLAAKVSALLNVWGDGNPVLECTANRPIPIPDDAGPHWYLSAEAILIGNPTAISDLGETK